MQSRTNLYENTGIPNPKLGMMLFLASEVMFFTGLIGAHIVIRQAATDWPQASTLLNIPLTALASAFLIASTVTFYKAVTAAKKDDQKGKIQNLFLTFLLGNFFLGFQLWEYAVLIHEKNVLPSSHLFGASFYTLTGFHAAHLFGGLVCLAFVMGKAVSGKSSEDLGVETLSYYWYFLAGVWLVLFSILYLF
jgi:cytochrome c oxidase subunit III